MLTKTYKDLKASRKRFSVHEGGTRSGKTYSILSGLAELCYRNKGAGIYIDIARVNGPAIDAGPLRDWREILAREGWLSPRHQRHDKIREFPMWGNLVSFFSVDQGYKLHGRKRHILFMNEANQFTHDAFRQLNMRTDWRVIMDYNPYETENWIYDKVLTRKDAELFHSTFKDNPYLSPELVREIEVMQFQDDWYWQVYGLGQRSANPSQVFRNWRVEKMPEKLSDGTREREPKFMCLALDWGFSNDPTAVVALWEGLSREVKTQSGVILNKPEVYVREMLYQTGLTNPEVAEKLKGIIKELKLPESAPVVCDSADPKSIEEVRRAGINAVPASKGPDSVRMGIQLVNQHVHIVDPFSENWQKEARSYKYQMDKNGKVTNVPVDRMNHLMDATRYGDDYWFNNRYTGEYVIS